MDDWQRDFLPQFLSACEERIQRAARALEIDSRLCRTAFWQEMHALGSEAAVMELTDIHDIAREAESEGKAWAASDAPEAKDKCVASLQRVRDAVDEIRISAAAAG